tara:strand:- start:571 stop:1263 length:693 start_codon:yes stop_codon:yes gene_type:complete
MKNKTIFLTGNSSGLGKALNKKLVKENRIYSISKSKSSFNNEQHLIFDFNKVSNLYEKMRRFDNIEKIDFLILNAGVLGDINKSFKTKHTNLQKVININLISNKIILDFFLEKKVIIKNVIAISSGAALNPKEGWLEYCVSKCAMKMLIDVYSIENKRISFLNLSPGIIKTKMQKKIFLNKNDIDSLKKFKKLYINDKMDYPDTVATKIINYLNSRKEKKKNYVDLRNIN